MTVSAVPRSTDHHGLAAGFDIKQLLPGCRASVSLFPSTTLDATYVS